MFASFHEGGWGMYLTTAIGLVLFIAALRHAVAPSSRRVPLLVSLGIATLVSGGAGFVSGLIKSLQVGMEKPPEERYVAWIGLAETLHNLALALLLVLVASLFVAAGSYRLAQRE